ncbi:MULTISPECIES: hypothetical protein [unclassified Streptosporangium]|uniref:hypothetical protein n=1 Tax=unclassified Streptosporangium TaxID=2632669 RepID=UPI002E28716F|nr:MULTISPECIES: hypothetical protein [unclassified Streptosporangium]
MTRGESDAANETAAATGEVTAARTARTVNSGTTTSADVREARPARAANQDWVNER